MNNIDPVEALLSTPRSLRALEALGYTKEQLTSIKREELKAKLGNLKISKAELDLKWEEHEQQRKAKIQQVLEVSRMHKSLLFLPLLASFKQY